VRGSSKVRPASSVVGVFRKGARDQKVAVAYFDVARLAPGQGPLRRWQVAAMPVVMDAIFREPVLVEACPGAGKTQFGLEVAYRLVSAGKISRILVVVPTLGIADGWHRASSVANPIAPTLPLRNQRDWRAVNPIGDEWLGAVITYQSLFSSTEMFLAHATDPGHRTLVVFDEVHHAGANAAWGESAQEAFASGAKAILSLTGTPFRTASERSVRGRFSVPALSIFLRRGHRRQSLSLGAVRRGARRDNLPQRRQSGPHGHL